MQRFNSFSLSEVIVGVGIITLVFLSFGEVKNSYLNRNGDVIIKDEEVRLASSLIETISTYPSSSEIFNDFNFSNNSPLTNIQGNGFSAFTTVESFASQYSIPLSEAFTNKNYWVICSKSNLSYGSCNFLFLRVYVFRKYKEKWIITEAGRAIK